MKWNIFVRVLFALVATILTFAVFFSQNLVSSVQSSSVVSPHEWLISGGMGIGVYLLYNSVLIQAIRKDGPEYEGWEHICNTLLVGIILFIYWHFILNIPSTKTTRFSQELILEELIINSDFYVTISSALYFVFGYWILAKKIFSDE